VLYVVCYLAMGLPAVIAGFRVVHGGGILATAHEYGIAVILLAGAAMAGALLRDRGERPAPALASPPRPATNMVRDRESP
jgi:hypothetical protein